MSYTDFPPNEFAWRLAQAFQQGNMDQSQALLNQYSIPQYPPPPSSRSASYPAALQGQRPTSNFSTNMHSSLPPGSYSSHYQTNSYPAQFPVQFAHVPQQYAGISTPAYGSLDHIQRLNPQYNQPGQSDNGPSDHYVGSQQVVPTRSLQQNSGTLSYRDQSAPTNLTTIHPTLGLCVLVPIGALGSSVPQTPRNWSATSTAGTRHRDPYNDRVDRLRRRHSRELTPYMRYMSPSPPGSFSPYVVSPSSSVTVTPILHRRRRDNTPASGMRSPRRFRGIGGFTPLRSYDVPRPTIERSVSTVGTCSQCGGTEASSSYEPFTDGSVAPTPRIAREEDAVCQGDLSRGNVEGQESPVEDHRRFQARVEEVDE